MKLVNIIKLVIGWRLLLVVVATVAMWLVPFSHDFNLGSLPNNWLNPFTTWANFDGELYLTLAADGYLKVHYLQAFFPLYPILISIIHKFTNLSYYLSGLGLGNLAFIAAVLVLYKLIRLDLSQKTSRLTLFALLTFPTAFYLGSVYSESVFLLLTVGAFWFARKHAWFWAAVAAALASATRVSGIFVAFAVIIEFFQTHRFRPKLIWQNPQVVWLAITPLGLIAYMLFLNQHYGDPFYFAHVQSFFGAQRTTEKLILLHQVFYRYAKMMIFVDHGTLTFLVAFLELIGAVFFIGLILKTYKLRLSYFIYGTCSFILPTLTGTFSSLPRYSLVIFPAFIILAQWLEKRGAGFRCFYWAAMVILLSVLTMLFVQGHFVA